MSEMPSAVSILDIIAHNRARKQGEMVQAWQNHIDGGGTRATIVAACGLGKTVVSGQIALDYRSVVFLVPSIHLLIQAAKEWAARFGRTATVLVCSHKERKGALPGELDGVTITTQADDIKVKIGAAPFLIFATYDSYAAVGGALLDLGRSADLLVCDEAHHLAGAEGKVRAKVLHNDHLPATLRLFLTATPRINTRGEAKMLGMDNEALFGPTVITAGFGEARELSLVCDHKILVVRVPASVDTDHPAALAAAMHNATKKALDDGLFRFAIGFRRTIDLCEESAAELRRLGVKVAVVSGKQTVPERMKQIAEIQASGGVVLTSQAVGEGVDIPAVDAVLFFDEKESIVSITQNAGRALRIDPTRLDKVAYIVAPVIVHDDAEVTFTGALGTVLAALSALDERLYATLRATSTAPADPATAREWTGKEVEVWTLDEMSAAGLGAAMFREAAGAWHPSQGRNHQQDLRNVRRIAAFVSDVGRLPRSDGGTALERELGEWIVNKFRPAYWAGELSPAAMAEAEAISVWAWRGDPGPATPVGRALQRAKSPRPGTPQERAVRARLLTLLAIGETGCSVDAVMAALGVERVMASRNLKMAVAAGLATATPRYNASHWYTLTPAGTAYLAEHNEPTEQAAK